MERIDKIQTMLIENPTDSFLQHALALEYVKIGNDQEAKKLFESILARESAYIGSYYHLAKLLERQLDEKGAIAVYEKGMKEAILAGDQHAYNELRSALEELTF